MSWVFLLLDCIISFFPLADLENLQVITLNAKKLKIKENRKHRESLPSRGRTFLKVPPCIVYRKCGNTSAACSGSETKKGGSVSLEFFAGPVVMEHFIRDHRVFAYM